MATALLLPCCLAYFACVELPQVSTPETHAPDAMVAVDAAGPPTKSLRFGAWNVRKLGFERDKDLGQVAAIIERHLDLVAIVELMWSAEDDAFAQLLTELGPGWAGHTTSAPRPNLPYEQAERYAVAYRLQCVSPCRGQQTLEFIADNDGSRTSGEPDLFLREPAIGCYRAAPELGGLDLLLGVYHARWGTGQSHEIAREVQHVDRVFAAMQQRVPGERQLYLLGDFNLEADSLAALTSARVRTRGAGSTLSSTGAISQNLYDHLLAFGDEANASLADDAVVVDVRGEATDPTSFRQHVSDHLPIVARLPLVPDRD